MQTQKDPANKGRAFPRERRVSSDALGEIRNPR